MEQTRIVKLRYILLALADLSTILDYIATRSPQGAWRVQSRVQAIIDLLLQHPHIGTSTDDPTIRRMTTSPYPYLIFYEATETEIIIHAARRSALREAFVSAGFAVDHSEAGLYLWLRHPEYDGWAAAEMLAGQCGILVTPGSVYGPAGDRHVRVALTATDERVAAAVKRLAALAA